MEKRFESCWGNRSVPLKKIPNPCANLYRMESTTFGKIPLVSINYILNHPRWMLRRKISNVLLSINYTFNIVFQNYGTVGKNDIVPQPSYLETPKLSKAKNKSSVPNKSSECNGQIKLSDCSTLGDMFANIHQMMLPCQAISLISNPHLFYLLMLNPNATEMKERLSFTLYHTLHNEFLSQSCEKGNWTYICISE